MAHGRIFAKRSGMGPTDQRNSSCFANQDMRRVNSQIDAPLLVPRPDPFRHLSHNPEHARERKVRSAREKSVKTSPVNPGLDKEKRGLIQFRIEQSNDIGMHDLLGRQGLAAEPVHRRLQLVTGQLWINQLDDEVVI